MEGIIMTAQLLLALSILVVVHEFGHYIAARMFGIKVEKFYLFFDAGGIKLFSFKKGDTEYGVGWLPLGGYVKIAGMIDESLDKEHLKREPEDWEFRSKPAWQRLIVMVGGVFLNVVLGIIIFSLLTFSQGTAYIDNTQLEDGIVAHSLAQEVGLETGDRIIAINGEVIHRFGDINQKALFDREATFTVLRNGEEVFVTLPSDFMRRVIEQGMENFISPRATYYVDRISPGSRADEAGLLPGDRIQQVGEDRAVYFHELQHALRERAGGLAELVVERDGQQMQLQAQVNEDGTLGFSSKLDLPTVVEDHGLGRSIVLGTENAMNSLVVTVKGLGRIITGDIPARESVSGPIGIAFVFGGQWNWLNFWVLTATLSMVLAFMNMLPIPALDGGHVMFLLAEMIRGRELSPKFMEIMQIIGVVILLTLMVLIFGNDIVKHFFS